MSIILWLVRCEVFWQHTNASEEHVLQSSGHRPLECYTIQAYETVESTRLSHRKKVDLCLFYQTSPYSRKCSHSKISAPPFTRFTNCDFLLHFENTQL